MRRSSAAAEPRRISGQRISPPRSIAIAICSPAATVGENPLPDDGVLGRVAWSSGRGRLCDADRDSRVAEDVVRFLRPRAQGLAQDRARVLALGRGVLLGTLGAEVPDLTERGAKKRGGETSRPGTQVAIVSPDRLDEELPFLAALIDLLTDSVRYVKINRVYGESAVPRTSRAG